MFNLFIFQDAFEAFEKKICINSYPEAFSPAFDLAELTADVLIRIARYADLFKFYSLA